jgi:hypothetical protein
MTPSVRKSHFERFCQNAGRLLAEMKSENVGGLLSMAGSCLFLLGGDANGVIVTLSFLAAEVVLARYGHLRGGYSAGCAFFAFGDALAVSSEIARGNFLFQATLAIMAVAWMIGAARGPLAWWGARVGKSNLVKAADKLQPIVGATILALRLPSFLIALIGANYLAAIAVAFWGAADILIGRLQNIFRRPV